MPKITTDNFLPYTRGKSGYRRRPIGRSPRHDYAYQDYGRRRPISDILPPKTSPLNPQLVITNPVISAQLVPTSRQFTSDLSAKTKTRLKSTSVQKQLIYALTATVLVLGITTGLTSFKTGRQQIAQVKALQTTVAKETDPYPLKQEQTTFKVPVRLKIPKINVDAAIDPMGLTPSGDMEAPSGPKNAGWFKFGPRPGDKGNAVIAGHYGRWENGEKSVFQDLSKLSKGDSLYVKDESGATITFVVRELRRYGKDEKVPAVFNSSDAQAHLNLITCEGNWSKTQQTYSDRLVVFADKKAEQ